MIRWSYLGLCTSRTFSPYTVYRPKLTPSFDSVCYMLQHCVQTCSVMCRSSHQVLLWLRAPFSLRSHRGTAFSLLNEMGVHLTECRTHVLKVKHEHQICGTRWTAHVAHLEKVQMHTEVWSVSLTATDDLGHPVCKFFIILKWILTVVWRRVLLFIASE